MSRTIAKAILPGAGATIMYGLYYTWKKRRMVAWMESETAVTLVDSEKLCLQSMLSGKSIVKNALRQLFTLLQTDFGVDISKTFNDVVVAQDFTQKYIQVIDYYVFLQKMHKMYKKHASAADSDADKDMPAFFKEWFILFQFPNTDSASTSASFNIEGELIRRAKSSIEQMLRVVVQSNKAQNSEWIQSEDLFVDTLKTHNCINVDGRVGLKRVFQEP
jgi:hypothetical protein